MHFNTTACCIENILSTQMQLNKYTVNFPVKAAFTPVFQLRLHLHWNGPICNWYEIGTNKPFA